MDSHILEAAQLVCQRATGMDCRLEFSEELVGPDWGRSTIWRCSLSGNDSLPHSVIVKTSNLGQGHGSNEAAVLERLQFPQSLRDTFPRLLGFDPAHGLLVLHDLGNVQGQRIVDIRSSMEREKLMELLGNLLALLGSLNRCNPSTDAAWHGFANVDPATDATGHAAFHLSRHIRNLPAAFEMLGIRLSPAALQETDACLALLENPAGWCLTHADFCPSNTALINSRLIIYDFEMAGMRSPAIDAVWPRMRALRCYHFSSFTAEEILQLEQAWARAFDWPASAAAALSSFSMLVSCGCLAWLAAMLAWLPGLLEANHERDELPDRERLLLSLQAMLDCHSDHAQLPAFTNACNRLLAALKLRWPESAAAVTTIKS